jgi:hypothetical protein
MHAVCSTPTFRAERGDEAKRTYLATRTLERWKAMRMWAGEARRLNLRAANRRYRRRNGLSLLGA